MERPQLEHVVPLQWWSDPQVRQILEDLAGFVAMAERLHGRGETTFMGDEALPLAAEAVINRIGEAVNRLPDAFKADFPDVPWKAIRGMRKLLTHHYGSANPVMIWQTLGSRCFFSSVMGWMFPMAPLNAPADEVSLNSSARTRCICRPQPRLATRC